MLNKIKRLEGLVKEAAALIGKLEEENAVLRRQLQALNADRQRMMRNAADSRELAQFKEKVRGKLARINDRIEKAITLQDTLFGEDFDDRP